MHFPALPVVPEAFRKIDSHQKAYLLGFLMADGCVMLPRPGICRSVVNLKIKACDIAVCLMAQEVAGGNVRLMEGGYRAIWEMNNDALVSDLIRLGITPRKTFTAALEWNLVPAHLHGCVLAGLIDGDGNTRFDRQKRRAEVSIATASTALKDQLLERFPFFRAVEVPPGGKRKHLLYRVSVENHRERLRALLSLVYDSMPFHALPRKQAVVNRIRAYLNEQDAYDRAMNEVPMLAAKGFTQREIADSLGTSLRPVRERLRAAGVDSRKTVFTEDDFKAMRHLHVTGHTVLEIHAAIGKGTEQAVRHHLVRMELVLRKSQPVSKHPRTDEIIDLHQQGMTVEKIADCIGSCRRVVARVLRDAGFTLESGSPKKLEPAGVQWAASELAAGRTLRSVSMHLGVSDTLLRLRLKQLHAQGSRKQMDDPGLAAMPVME